ncbi:hypothetical protein GCM10027030_24350 [Luteococcus sediminum]
MLLVAWGALVLAADSVLNGFDLLPDAIGWGLVTAGLVESRMPDGPRVLLLAVAGLACSLLDFAVFFSESAPPWLGPALHAAAGLAWMAVLWLLLARLADGLHAQQSSRAHGVRRLLVVLEVLLALQVLWGLAQALPGVVQWPAVGVLLAMAVLLAHLPLVRLAQRAAAMAAS